MNPARERGGRREGGGGHTSALPLRAGGRPIGRPPPAEGTRWPRAPQRVEAPPAPHPRAATRARARAARGPRASVRSPFGALPTVRRRLPLTLSLERGGRGLTRKPPQPRGYLHGTGGKNSRRGVAARLLFVGGNPPSMRDTARRSLLLLDDAVGLADGDGCPAVWRNVGGAWGSRAPARDYYMSLWHYHPILPPPNIIYPSPRVTK